MEQKADTQELTASAPAAEASDAQGSAPVGVPDKFRLRTFLAHWPAILAAFVSGCAVMSLELLESRLMAPFFGSSILVWTNIIGVILAAMALGAWAGGAAADRRPKLSTVAAFFLASGAWALLLALAGKTLLAIFVQLPAGWVVPLTSLVLFAPPAFLLGAVPPAVLRLTVTDVRNAGHAAGLLTAVGTLGSLAGTYATGYVLLPRMPVSELLVGVGAGLVAIGLLLWRRQPANALAAAFCVGLVSIPGIKLDGSLSPNAEMPSAYNYVAVREQLWEGTPARLLIVNAGYHSGASLETPDTSIFEYVKSFQALDELVPDADSMLLVGGGGMHAANEFVRRHAGSTATAIEIDPAIYRTALEAFGPIDTSRITTILDDARSAMGRLRGKYDVVVVDAYGGDHCVPWQLLTREAVAEYAGLLKPGGVWAANVILETEPRGPAGELFRSRLVGTLRTSFDWVSMFTILKGSERFQLANVLVLAGHGPPPDAAKIQEALRTKYGVPLAAAQETGAAGEPWTDDAGQADYGSLAMYNEARSSARTK